MHHKDYYFHMYSTRHERMQSKCIFFRVQSLAKYIGKNINVFETK